MALWAKVKQLQGDALRQVHTVYGDHFPIEVRFALAQWIEEKPWMELDPDNPQHEQYAGNLVAALVQEVESKLASEENFLIRLKLSEAATFFKENYFHNPKQLVRVVKHCLQTEKRTVQQAENLLQGMGGGHVQFPPDPHQEITMQIEKLRHKSQETDEDLRRMQEEQETFVIQYQESSKRQGLYLKLKLSIYIQTNSSGCHLVGILYKFPWCEALADIIWQNRQQIKRVEMLCTQLPISMPVNVTDKLPALNQQITGLLSSLVTRYVYAKNNNLVCEALADIIWQNRQQIKRVEMLCTQLPISMPVNVTDKLPALNQQITGLLSSLVTRNLLLKPWNDTAAARMPTRLNRVYYCSIIYIYIIKMLFLLTIAIRHCIYILKGFKKMKRILSNNNLFYSESQAIALLKNDKVGMGDASGEILNNTGTMEYHQATRQLSVSFRNMVRNNFVSVMDEKFSLLFQSQFKVGGGELVFQVWTLSLPVVVIVHGNQEPHAWATVTWDNAFAEPVYRNTSTFHQGRVPFQVPEKVKWYQMAEVLSTKFKATTGRELSEDNLRFLAGKAFRNAQLQDANNMLLTWSQFCKEPLPERNFTFWEWFYAIMKVTREHLRGPWNDGLILGFVARRKAEEMLLKRCNGTFLLRFSDSELGGVTIAWVTEAQPQSDIQEVFMLQPFTGRDFAIRSLADRIYDLKTLLHLYPDIPKDQCFGKYYTPISENQASTNNGYVKPVLVTQIPGWQFMNDSSYPSTPQSLMHPQSPDPAYQDGASVNSCADHAMK
ncbi:signal transducer and activator of transcription 5B-like [Centruroides sculpturatus]|uniref:signal transducer and activator of transcription 5B-like n=1 Tax=Centruroides sculpturatus TaxID=218467 RepID=UPI000C6E53D6|nr:signal transducer and activator of transcription 5B-like [Centruroides sculpturatus]